MEQLNNYTYRWGLLLMLCLLACTTEDLGPRHLVQWVEAEQNGLRSDKKMHPYSYRIQYKPIDYIIAMEEGRDDLANALVTRRRKELGEEMDYFNFRVSMNSTQKNVLLETANTEGDYYQLIDYLSYNAQNDFYMIQGADTARCLLYHFARNYDMAPYLEFALAFERRENEDRTFVYDDKIFGTGIIKAQLQQQKINRIPKLKTK